MKLISSHDNAKFKAIKKLCVSGRERQKTKLSILEGMHLVESYIQHYGVPEKIVISKKALESNEINELVERVLSLAPSLLASVTQKSKSQAARGLIGLFTDTLFNELSETETPAGILAVIKTPHSLIPVNRNADTVLLDDIQDPGNVGSILRSAAAVGFKQIILSSGCAKLWSPKTLRAGMGAHFLLNCYENTDLSGFIAEYQGQTVATSLHATRSLYALDLTKPTAWIFGNEGQGCHQVLTELTSSQIRIPMPGATESLNVAAAASVCLFETIRQRLAKSSFA
jgi:TrmH family RNA methyltransferase